MYAFLWSKETTENKKLGEQCGILQKYNKYMGIVLQRAERQRKWYEILKKSVSGTLEYMNSIISGTGK